MDSCCGPALWWARVRAFVLWTQILLTTAVAYFTVEAGYRYPWWVWPFFLCSVAFGLYAEWRCVKYFLVPWVQQVHGCLTPLLPFRSFSIWLPLVLAYSVLAMTSIQTNALFMLSFQGKKNDISLAVWEYVMKESKS